MRSLLLITVIFSCFSFNYGGNTIIEFLKKRTYYEAKFFDWMKEHKISFTEAEEFVHRLNIFAKNDDFINKHNKYSQASYTLGHNQFSHLSWEEFSLYARGYNSSASVFTSNLNVNKALLNVAISDIPDSKDWVLDGAVSSVKNQGQCGSCWAFSAVGAVEGAAFLSSQKLFNLSEQELVDCDKQDMGCGGGLMDHAFKWIEKHGVCLFEDYPYHAKREKCKKCKTRVKVSRFYDVPSNNETALRAAVAQQPVAVAIEADQPAFQFYKKGIFNTTCGNKIDHGVLLVGYGEENGKKYWKIKNSWGPSWGDNGFIRISRDVVSLTGQCGIAMAPSYAIAEVATEEIQQKKVEPQEELQKSKTRGSSASITQCDDKSTSLVLFNELSVNPSKPSRGKPVYFSGSGIIKESIADKNTSFALVVNLGGTQVYSDSGTMCGDSTVNLPLGLGKIDIHGFQCPIQKGAFKNIGVDVTLPEIAPPGVYEIDLISTHATQEVFCVHVKLDLRLIDFLAAAEDTSTSTVYAPLSIA